MAMPREIFLKLMKEANSFHKEVQASWAKERGVNPEGIPERSLKKDTGRPGRADVFVTVEDDHVAIVEIKYTIWDKKPQKDIKRLMTRYARQLYSYMDSKEFEEMDKTLGIIFPQRPKNNQLTELVEDGFGEYGISVVWWDDESN